MTGTVLEVFVSVGEKVNTGQELLIVESMKMEIPVESPYAGTVTEVLAQAQQKIEEGVVLLRLDA
jgi:acetyl-CoA carboxylase biotin carboxyl carrier protein